MNEKPYLLRIVPIEERQPERPVAYCKRNNTAYKPHVDTFHIKVRKLTDVAAAVISLLMLNLFILLASICIYILPGVEFHFPVLVR